MFNCYYDKINFEKFKGADKFGGETYEEPVERLARFVKGKDTYSVDSETKGVTYKRIYHVPFEIKEKDKIDGRLVVEVQPIRDILGKFMFFKVGVV